MRKIDLNELYGGYWEWHDHYGDGKGGILQIKPLREHLQEWLKMTDYYFVRNNKQYSRNQFYPGIQLVYDRICRIILSDCYFSKHNLC